MKIDNILQAAAQSVNVNFVYNITSNQFQYLDDNLKKELNVDIDNDSLLNIIHPEDIADLKQPYQHLLENTFKGDVEFRITLRDQLHWLRVTPFLIATDTESVIIGHISNITAAKNNIYSLEKFANKKNSVLNMLSHDLRGPLEIARMIAHSLKSNANDPAIVVNQSQNLVKILKQGLDLVNDLIQREATETLRIELVKRRLNLAEKLKEYMDELKLSEDALHRVINYASASDEIYAFVDEAKFMQVLNNLVSNSLKFTHSGDTVLLTLEEQNDKVIIKFSDTGIGIPQQYHEQLFEKFTPAGRKGLEGEPSIGLGLSIIKDIVEWHEGRIWVESEEEKGTTFFIEVPKQG